MSTQFPTGPTRDIQPGDTPDLNDGQLSIKMAAQNIPRGTACFVQNSGNVTIATSTAAPTGYSAFVPVESVDNSSGTAGGTAISGVIEPQRIAVTYESTGTETLNPGDYLKISATTAGRVTEWLTTDSAELKYARFLGIEAALFERNSGTPFGESLTPGIIPDQSVTFTAAGQTKVIWVQLVESLGGT